MFWQPCFFIVAAVYIGVLYDTQVNNYDYYYASSVRSIARSETVEAARGNITDRNGKVLVSSRSSYNLTFDASLLEKDEDANESLLRLLQLCQSRGINWVDSLPISRSAPFAYTIDSPDSAARSRFLTYLEGSGRGRERPGRLSAGASCPAGDHGRGGQQGKPLPTTSWRMRSWIRPARPRPCWRS